MGVLPGRQNFLGDKLTFQRQCAKCINIHGGLRIRYVELRNKSGGAAMTGLQHRFAGYACGAALAAMTVGALAQDGYPVRPVKLVVPSSPGGGTDTTARILAPKLAEYLGQQVVVENRAGASGIVGMDVAARAAPDGYTLLIANSTMTILPSTHRKLPFDPVKDLAPVTKVVELPQLLVGHPAFPGKNLKELIAIAKARPGELDYAAGGFGGSGHLAMEMFMHMAGVRITFVPYKSGHAGIVDALSGQVPLMMASALGVLPHVKAGKLRAYGVSGSRRTASAPDIQTIAEAGVPGFETVQWYGVLVPAGTPRNLISRLHGLTVRALQDPGVAKGLVNDGAEAAWSKSPEDYGSFMRAEIEKWARVVRLAGIKQQ